MCIVFIKTDRRLTNKQTNKITVAYKQTSSQTYLIFLAFTTPAILCHIFLFCICSRPVFISLLSLEPKGRLKTWEKENVEQDNRNRKFMIYLRVVSLFRIQLQFFIQLCNTYAVQLTHDTFVFATFPVYNM